MHRMPDTGCGAQEEVPMLAYIDAGTGSMVLQAIIAGIFSIAIFSKTVFNWFKKSLLHRKSSDHDHDQQ